MSTADSHLPPTIRENEALYELLHDIQKKLDWIISQMVRDAKSKM